MKKKRKKPEEQPETPKRKPNRTKMVIYFLLFAVFVCCAVLFGMFAIAVNEALWAENGLHANMLVHDVVRQYVLAHDGQWPRSWEDLKTTVPSDQFDYKERWPKDFGKVRKRVEIDFDADPEVLATQTIEQFDAIKPIGSFYPYKDYSHVWHCRTIKFKRNIDDQRDYGKLTILMTNKRISSYPVFSSPFEYLNVRLMFFEEMEF